MEIIIIEELEKMIPALQSQELELLEKSILQDGIREPLVLWCDMLVDGHNRYAIAQKHNLEFKTVNREFENLNEVKLWIMENQLGRRNLITYVRSDFVIEMKKLLAEIGKQKQGARTDLLTVLSKGSCDVDEEKVSTELSKAKSHNTRKIMAEKAGVGQGTISKVEKIKKFADEETIEKLRTGKTSIDKVITKIRTDELEVERDKIAEEGRNIPKDERYELHCGDVATITLNKQYDFIITDPPYLKEHLNLYSDLARRAKEWLKPGGLLIAMAGQSYLNEIMNLMDEHLEYYWTSAYLTPGQPTPLRQRQVNTTWKPLLVYKLKDDSYKGKIFGDVYTSEKPDKTKHVWGQSESGMLAIIKQVCLPGQSILDPFVGAGTTGVAALKHECLFGGIDIEEKNIDISRRRLSDY